MATIDSLLGDLGGCGWFQVMIVASIDASTISAVWGVMFMAFGNYNPGLSCDYNFADSNFNFSHITANITPFTNVTTAPATTNITETKQSCDGYSQCKNVRYSADASTIVTEWDLACDNSYIVDSITSIQMAGLFIGGFSAGPLNNIFGRKRSHFAYVSSMSVLNLIIAFSVNWQMFAGLRFFVGIACGGILVTSYVYQIEFIMTKWRSIVSSIPAWNFGAVMFVISAMYFKDWRKLHLLTSGVSFLIVIPVFWVTESIRWLSVKGRTEDACKIAKKISRMNGRKEFNTEVIYRIAAEEKKREEENPGINALNLYKSPYHKRTIIISSMWLGFSVIYYAILFDVKSLSGNIYINLMISAVITTPSRFIASFLANNIGRKLGTFSFLILAAIGFAIIVAIRFSDLDDNDKNLAYQILTFIILMCADAGWLVGEVYTVELYPTILRSLGLSNASCISRLGAIIAPFLFPDNPSIVYISHIVMVVFLTGISISVMFLHETGNKQMEDTMYHNQNGECYKYKDDGSNDKFIGEGLVENAV